MGFICDACGGRFDDRLDHIETCKGPFPASWWNEDDGDVLWWCWDGKDWLGEAPYVGGPLDCGITVEMRSGDQPQRIIRTDVGGWPGYHTHWTRLPPQPPTPEYPKGKTV